MRVGLSKKMGWETAVWLAQIHTKIDPQFFDSFGDI